MAFATLHGYYDLCGAHRSTHTGIFYEIIKLYCYLLQFGFYTLMYFSFCLVFLFIYVHNESICKLVAVVVVFVHMLYNSSASKWKQKQRSIDSIGFSGFHSYGHTKKKSRFNKMIVFLTFVCECFPIQKNFQQ